MRGILTLTSNKNGGDTMIDNVYSTKFLEGLQSRIESFITPECERHNDTFYIQILLDLLITYRVKTNKKGVSLGELIDDIGRILIDETFLKMIISRRKDMPCPPTSELVEERRIGVVLKALMSMLVEVDLPMRDKTKIIHQIDKIEKMNSTLGKGSPSTRNLISSPIEIYDELRKKVIGQDRVLLDISIFSYEYIKSREISNNTIALIGESGCGKTHIAESLAEILHIPHTIIDISGLSPEGFSGKSVSSDIEKLIDEGLKKSPNKKLLVVLDEFDKICLSNHDAHGDDINHIVCSQLMNLLSGRILKSGNNSNQCLYVLCGCFYDLREEKKKSSNKNTIGFGSIRESNEDEEQPFLTREDLISAGMLPEFARRIQNTLVLDPLSDEMIIGISELQNSSFQKRNRKVKECYGLNIDPPRIVREIVINHNEDITRDGYIGLVENQFNQVVNKMIYEHLKINK